MQGARICRLLATLDKPVNMYLKSLTAQPLSEISIAKPSPENRALESGRCGLSLAGTAPPTASVSLLVKWNGHLHPADVTG